MLPLLAMHSRNFVEIICWAERITFIGAPIEKIFGIAFKTFGGVAERTILLKAGGFFYYFK